MNKFRLKQIYNAVFIPNTKEALENLYKVSNYVIYGYLPWKQIDTLLKTRGHINIDEKKVPLNDNN